jgi:Hydroxymethylglutaryl-coenzyme A synthase N terminal
MHGVRSFDTACRQRSGPMNDEPATDDVQVSQEELERHDGVAAGKYTAGLGQVIAGCCGHHTRYASCPSPTSHVAFCCREGGQLL